jgi:serine acetyltransferase
VREQAYQTVVIGNDVWIGAQAIIMPGVKIGDGAVIGAGSIVTKDVEPYEIVCGNPARHLRWRLGEREREFMKMLRWWDWSDEKIKENIDLFRAPVNADMFGSNT